MTRGWRPLLRLAWRDARRARGRSLLVLVMIALPVLAVTAADVVISTQDLTSKESLDRRLGSADALVSLDPYATNVVQAFDPNDGSGSGAGSQSGNDHTFADVRRVLGADARSLELRDGDIRVTTDKGVAQAVATEVDATDPMADGMFRLSSGHYPKSDDEAAINQALADRGFGVGDRLEVVDGRTLTVVGIAESGSFRSPAHVLARPGSLGLTTEGAAVRHWLVEAGPVSWDQVRELNKLGATVLSRSVIENPPPKSELPSEITSFGTDDAWLAIVILVVSMALLEVVLLAGPAFAVSARRQSRTIALMAATGATPEQARRLVLAGGIVLGGIAAAVGVVAGIIVGRLAVPLAQGFADSRFGPFDVPWLHLLGIAAFGLASAVLAAVVPAWIASRQDVVAVLAGRRGDRKPSLRSPALGLVLLGAGITGAAYGAKASSMGEIFIAGSAVIAVLGMILLIPVAVVGLARLSRRLPLPLRFAVRDAARHRTRTVPAVAAVAATVAGVVALGIGITSDAAETEQSYTEQLPMGMAQVTGFYTQAGRTDPAQWDRYAAAVASELPAHRVVRISGVPEDETMTRFEVPGTELLLANYASALGSPVLVDDELPDAALGIQKADLPTARQALARGEAVVFADDPVAAKQVTVVIERFNEDGTPASSKPVPVPAVFLQPEGRTAMAQAVLPQAVAERIGLEVATMSLLVDGPVSEAAETDLQEALAAISPDASLYVERGYQAEDETVIVQLVLAALGAVLMLGGTLTATFLALSDARPDLATLAAVGAAPRSRRLVGAAYALVVGLVGAVLGAAVGFIPGIAVTYPLTGQAWAGSGADGPSHYLDVPWLLIVGLVVGLPLLTAAVVGLSARSRLPMMARID